MTSVSTHDHSSLINKPRWRCKYGHRRLFRARWRGGVHVTRSRDKDGGYMHPIRFATWENSMLHAKFNGCVCVFYTAGVIDWRRLRVEGFSTVFAPVILSLPDDLHIRTWPVFPGDVPDVRMWSLYVQAFESYRLTDRHTYTQTDRHDRNHVPRTPLRGWPKIIQIG